MRVSRCTITAGSECLYIVECDATAQALNWFFEQSVKKVLPKLYEHIQREHPKKSVPLQTVIEGVEALLHSINPKTVVKELIQGVKKHGWKLGLAMGFWELFEHFLMPAILAYFGMEKAAIAAGTLPWGELIVYPLATKVLNMIGK